MTAYRAARSAWRNLCGGVTRVRDLGGPQGIPVATARALREGILPGCRVLAAGSPICQTGGHVFTMGREADGPEEVRKAVREQIKAGADLIKIMCSGGAYTEGESVHSAQLTPAEIRAAVEEAHASGRRIAAHALPQLAVQNCLDAGVDTVEHSVFIGEENIRAFLRTGAFMVPTLAPYFVMAVEGEAHGVPLYAVLKSRRVMEHYGSSLQRAASMGIHLALGTDAGSPRLPHPSVPLEAWLWHKIAGVDPLTVLRAATLGSSRSLGLPGEAGLFRPGGPADFVLYETNPLEDLKALHFPRAVYQDGRQVFGASTVWSAAHLER